MVVTFSQKSINCTCCFLLIISAHKRIQGRDDSWISYAKALLSGWQQSSRKHMRVLRE